MLAALPLAWRLALAGGLLLAVIGGVGGLYLKIRHDAYQDGYQKARVECAAEKAAMDAANKKAIAEAEKKLAEAERELAEVELKLEDYINALDLLADADPDAGRCGLGAPSVRRLQAIG